MTDTPVGAVLKDSSKDLYKKLKADVVHPTFYHDLAQFKRFEFM